MLRYTTVRARPGLVALYDIRPGNGAGQFLQPRSLHGAVKLKVMVKPKLACFKRLTDPDHGSTAPGAHSLVPLMSTPTAEGVKSALCESVLYACSLHLDIYICQIWHANQRQQWKFLIGQISMGLGLTASEWTKHSVVGLLVSNRIENLQKNMKSWFFTSWIRHT